MLVSIKRIVTLCILFQPSNTISHFPFFLSWIPLLPLFYPEKWKFAGDSTVPLAPANPQENPTLIQTTTPTPTLPMSSSSPSSSPSSSSPSPTSSFYNGARRFAPPSLSTLSHSPRWSLSSSSSSPSFT